MRAVHVPGSSSKRLLHYLSHESFVDHTTMSTFELQKSLGPTFTPYACDPTLKVPLCSAKYNT